MNNVLEACLFTPTHEVGPSGGYGLPVILYGKPSTGKTERILNRAHYYELPVFKINAELLAGDSLTAIPLHNQSGKVTYITMLPQLEEASQTEAGVLFIDELQMAGPNLPKLMNMMSEKRINELSLSLGTRMVAATNTEGLGVNAELSEAFRSRCVHLDVTPISVSDRMKYHEHMLLVQEGSKEFREKGKNHKRIEKEIEKKWTSEFKVWIERFKMLESNFSTEELYDNLGAHDREDKKSDVEFKRGYMCPRSLDNVKRLLCTMTCMGYTSKTDRRLALEACLGPASDRVYSLLQMEEEITKEDIFLGRKKVESVTVLDTPMLIRLVKSCIDDIVQDPEGMPAKLPGFLVLLSDITKNKGHIDILVPPFLLMSKHGIWKKLPYIIQPNTPEAEAMNHLSRLLADKTMQGLISKKTGK